MSEHAVLSPSSAHRWMNCPGSVAFNAGIDRSKSSFASFEGTVAHEIAAGCLNQDVSAYTYVGTEFTDDSGPFKLTVSEDMAAFIQEYVDFVRVAFLSMLTESPDPDSPSPGMLIETRLPLHEITGEETDNGDGTRGTADALLLGCKRLHVIDLKFGRGEEVNAVNNEQLLLYALAALLEWYVLYDIEEVTLTIFQPRRGHISSVTIPVRTLQDFKALAFERAAATRDPNAPRVPGEKQCLWCPSKGVCPELQAEVLNTVGITHLGNPDDFDAVAEAQDEGAIGDKLKMVPMVESWCRAVRAEAEKRLLEARPVKGFKLVQGKRGNRKWTSEDEAEQQLKAFRLKVEEMYDLKLISPTTAEKLNKGGALGPKQWTKLKTLITQSEGTPSVAPETDPRPAILPTQASVEDFDDVTQE